MATFVLIHGGGDVGESWHLVVHELRARGHEVIAPDLPCDDDTATLVDYADSVLAAIARSTGNVGDVGDVVDVGDVGDVGDAGRPFVVVAHSYGGFTAPLVAARLPADLLVFVTAMVPAPGEQPADWWTNTGHAEAVAAQARDDGGLTGNEDPFVCYYHDVPRELAERAERWARGESEAAYHTAWPLPALPEVPTRFVLATQDRVFPPALMRRVAADRLGIEPDEIRSGHYVALAHPAELAELLSRYVDDLAR